MRLLLVIAAILSVCWTATISDSTTLVTNPNLLNSNYPRFIVITVEATNETPRSERIYMYKDGKMKNLLESGTCIAMAYSPTTITYFGARDGIYRYDDYTGKIDKYGTLNDDVIRIIKDDDSDDLYILAEDHIVYKVTEGGTKKVEIKEAKGALEIILDWYDNLFYFGDDNQPFVVLSAGGVKKIQGVFDIPRKVHLVKPFTKMNGIGYVSANSTYRLYPDGTSQLFVPNDAQRLQAEKVIQEVTAFRDFMKMLAQENNKVE